MINAKLETVTDRPAYRSLVAKGSRRALQLADGYYEWLKPEQRSDRSKAGPRQPFLFRVDGGVPFAFAALWTPAKVDGEWLHSVVLLTCDSAPNRVASAIHDRMPVVLADAAAADGLARSLSSTPRKRSRCAVRLRSRDCRRSPPTRH